MTSPAISVLMPVYNGEKHLAEAVDSILAQTFSDFEFIIVDDASTDTTPSILADYANGDSRIRILTNATNSKIAVSLNRGLAEARAPLVARMDADDWAHPERLAKQYAFMQAHPEVTVCGTWLEVYDTGELWDWAESDADIRVCTLFNACTAHPSVMFRKEAVMGLAGGYDVTMPPTEDYDLWARLMAHDDVRFANVPCMLLRYRTYSQESRESYCTEQKAAAQQVRLSLVRRLGLDPTAADMLCHQSLAEWQPLRSLRTLWACRAWAMTLCAANASTRVYDAQALHRFVEDRWRELWRRSARAWLSALWVSSVPECIRARYRAVKKRLLVRA